MKGFTDIACVCVCVCIHVVLSTVLFFPQYKIKVLTHLPRRMLGQAIQMR